MWTTFKDYRSKCKGNSYSGKNIKTKNGRTKNTCFVPLNARATNEYRHKKNLAYIVNRFNNPLLIKFFVLNFFFFY